MDRVHKNLSDKEIGKLAGSCYDGLGERGSGNMPDVAGLYRSVIIGEIRGHGSVEAGAVRIEAVISGIWRGWGMGYH